MSSKQLKSKCLVRLDVPGGNFLDPVLTFDLTTERDLNNLLSKINLSLIFLL